MRRTSLLLALATSLLAACGGAATPAGGGGAPQPARGPSAPATGADLVERMHAAWSGKWYRTLSLVQENTIVSASGREQKIEWRETARLPGRLRIEYLPPSGSGLLYADGKTHVFVGGKRETTRNEVNLWQLVTADLFAQSPAATTRLLDSLGIDMSKVRGGEWRERPVWIVGAADSGAAQLWVDRDRNLVWRLIVRDARSASRPMIETRVTGYADVEGIPLPTGVETYRDGRLTVRETFRDVKVNPEVGEGMFDPARWGGAGGRR